MRFVGIPETGGAELPEEDDEQQGRHTEDAENFQFRAILAHTQGGLMSTTAAMIAELEQEAATTRRVLERVPTDKLAWKPHDKSMSLGKLALHVAMSPGFITDWAVQDSTTFAGGQAPARSEVDRGDSCRARRERREGQGQHRRDRRRRHRQDVGNEDARRQDDDDDAEGRAPAQHRPQPHLPSSRPAVGVSAAARRAGAVDLRTERRREAGRDVRS